ncbi:hypothetical protein SNE40_022199 [Patella caerulea]|uniref:Transmembrane protein 233 n=1 Tax=Patella caerulea TaxID=87958 RepID=A0AAN8GAG2_PATCE
MATEGPASYENEIEVISEHEVLPDQLTVAVVEEERSSSSVKSTSPEQNVASQPLTGGDRVVRTYTKSPHYLPLAFLVCIINPPFGIVAVVFSLISRKYSAKGDFMKGGTHARISMWLCVVGIACSIVIGVFTAVYYLVIVPNIIRSLEELKT